MTKAEHTPGPWYIGLEDEYADGVPGIEIMFGKCPSAECELIAYISGNGDDLELTARDRHNARLIAAAPEMLEALINIIGWVDESWSGSTKKDVEQALAVIAKAKGE